MSVDFSGITEMRKRMEVLADDMPKIMEQLVIGEGAVSYTHLTLPTTSRV